MIAGMGRRLSAAGCMAVAFWAAPSVSAGFIQTSVPIAIGGGFTSEPQHLGFATGTITYRVGIDASGMMNPFSASLVISLTNTSPVSNLGFITGLAFRINGDATANFFGSGPNGAWQAATLGLLDLSPFSTAFDNQNAFEAGAEVSGMTGTGIAVGDTGEFRWDVSGTDALSLTALDFILGDTLPASDGFTAEQLIQFVLRFQGFDDEGSDKSQAVVVPLPAALPMGLAGLVGMVVMRRRWASTLKRSRSGSV